MRDFIVDGDTRTKSIGFDATDRADLVVTVGVLANRTQEATLLNELHRTIYEDGYRPFRTKSRDLSLNSEKIEELLQQFSGRVVVCIHQSNAKHTFAEPTHSGMILDKLGVTTDEAIAITDGDQSHADRLYRSSAAISVVPPPVANCVQSELYYPHLLLADLVAGVIADAVVGGATIPSSIPEDYSIEHIIDTTDERFSEQWNRGYSAVSRNEGEVQHPTYHPSLAKGQTA
jgi:hypothetical protein